MYGEGGSDIYLNNLPSHSPCIDLHYSSNFLCYLWASDHYSFKSWDVHLINNVRTICQLVRDFFPCSHINIIYIFIICFKITIYVLHILILLYIHLTNFAWWYFKWGCPTSVNFRLAWPTYLPLTGNFSADHCCAHFVFPVFLAPFLQPESPYYAYPRSPHGAPQPARMIPQMDVLQVLPALRK